MHHPSYRLHQGDFLTCPLSGAGMQLQLRSRSRAPPPPPPPRALLLRWRRAATCGGISARREGAAANVRLRGPLPAAC
jgi:hypothetical protein